MRCLFALFFAASSIFVQIDATEYDIPQSIRFTLEREESSSPIVYYFSQPDAIEKPYPIFIICDGSESKGGERSILLVRDFFAERVHSLKAGYIAIEKCGIDGNEIDKSEFWNRYTRSQRLKDHLQVIHYLEEHPPNGWNGQFIFAGVSEGGPLVTDLSIICPNTIATINWSGAGDWSWADELWQFFEHWKQNSFWIRLYDAIPRWMPFSSDIPPTRPEFDVLVQEIISNPTPDLWMGGMTYLYHADAFEKPPVDYTRIKTPFLVVAGAEDSIIESCDQFVQKAVDAGAPITYFRVDGMDHYIRKRPDVIDRTFDWLREQIAVWEEKNKQEDASNFFSSGHVTVPDGELYFESTGQGEPLIFIHAGFSDRRDWKHQIQDLRKEFNTIAYDQRGAGNSSVPTASFSPADDLRDIMDHLKIAKAALIGHSLGGTVALDFALQYPGRVSSLILVAPGLNGHVWSDEYAAWFKTIWSLSQPTDMLQQIMSAPFYTLAVTNPNIKSEVEMIAKENLEKILTWKNADIRWFFPEQISRLNELKIPTFVIYGDKDSQDIQQIVHALVENLPNVETTQMQNADHLLNFEKPAELNTLISNMLKISRP